MAVALARRHWQHPKISLLLPKYSSFFFYFDSFLSCTNLVYISGGMLEASIMSFQTIESAKSAEVVGSSRMELILYSPIANHTKFIPTKTIFAICVSTSKFPKVFSTAKMLVMGVRIAVLVVVMENMFNVEPDMYIIKAFMAICCPGFMASAMAFCLRFSTRAAVF